MKVLGNIIWFLFGGLISGLTWTVAGLLLCISIIGIPLARQCFLMARMSFSPFGRDVIFAGGSVSLLVNILWALTFGVVLALEHAAFGLVFCATIVGIPFGIQHFKLARLSLMPFGAQIIKM